MREERVSAECAAFVGACARVEEEVRQLRTELVRLVDAADRVADGIEVGVERMNTRTEVIVRCLGGLAFVAACARVEEEVRQLRTELVRLVDAPGRE